MKEPNEPIAEVVTPTRCPDCGHSLENNSHGPDQNDFYEDEDGGCKHRGVCTYCRQCNLALAHGPEVVTKGEARERCGSCGSEKKSSRHALSDGSGFCDDDWHFELAETTDSSAAPRITSVTFSNPTLYTDPENPDHLSFTPFAPKPDTPKEFEEHERNMSDGEIEAKWNELCADDGDIRIMAMLNELLQRRNASRQAPSLPHATDEEIELIAFQARDIDVIRFALFAFVNMRNFKAAPSGEKK